MAFSFDVFVVPLHRPSDTALEGTFEEVLASGDRHTLQGREKLYTVARVTVGSMVSSGIDQWVNKARRSLKTASTENSSLVFFDYLPKNFDWRDFRFGGIDSR